LTFDDGSPLYNERELSHMRDVKVVAKNGLAIWNVCLLVLVAFWVWSWRRNRLQAFRQGFRRGGWVTIGLVITIGFFAAVAFWQFFTLFHALFFEGDSWVFLYSDTLIRLFPIRFWQDVFIAAGFIVVGGALVLAFKLKPGVE
jgi:integral membrane protein (TIGR01906 family)